MRLEDIAVGQMAEFTKTVTETDVVLFAGITGDFNPAHVNAVEAERGMFGGRIAHGLLSAGFISTVLAMKLPGPGTIYLSQNLRFVRPVKIGDTVTAKVEVAEVIASRRRVRLSTTVGNQRGETVIDGEAVVMVPEPAALTPPAPLSRTAGEGGEKKDEALSTQHSALSTQHSALSTSSRPGTAVAFVKDRDA